LSRCGIAYLETQHGEFAVKRMKEMIVRNHQEMLGRIRQLPVSTPEADKIDSPHHASHKQHWIGWLEGYGGPGYYGRGNANRDSAFIYNHIQCAGMMIWLAEAVGVQNNFVRQAVEASSSIKNSSRSAAAARRILPWNMIAPLLWPPSTK